MNLLGWNLPMADGIASCFCFGMVFVVLTIIVLIKLLSKKPYRF